MGCAASHSATPIPAESSSTAGKPNNKSITPENTDASQQVNSHPHIVASSGDSVAHTPLPTSAEASSQYAVAAAGQQQPNSSAAAASIKDDWDHDQRHYASLENQVVSYISFRAAQGIFRYLALLCHIPLEQLTSLHCQEYFRAQKVYPPTWQAVPPQELFKKPPGDHEDMLLLLPGEEPEPMRVCQYFLPNSSPLNDGTVVLTYAWQEPLWGVLSAVERELTDSIKLGGVRIWIDILFIHQAPSADIVRELNLAKNVYSHSLHHFCTSAQAMTRAWCIFELWTRWNTPSTVGTFPLHSNRYSTTFLWDDSLDALLKLERELREHREQPFDYFSNMNASIIGDKTAIQASILKQCSVAQFNVGVHNHFISYVMDLLLGYIERQGKPKPPRDETEGVRPESKDMHAGAAELSAEQRDRKFAERMVSAARLEQFCYWPKSEEEQQRLKEGLAALVNGPHETEFERLFTGYRYQEWSDLTWERMGGRDLVLKWLALPYGSEQRRQLQDSCGDRLLEGASSTEYHVLREMSLKFDEQIKRKRGTGLKRTTE